MDQTNFELPSSHNFLFRIIQILVKDYSHNVNITGQSLEIVIALFGAKFSSTENVLNHSWHKQFFKFSQQTVSLGWDVQVSIPTLTGERAIFIFRGGSLQIWIEVHS